MAPQKANNEILLAIAELRKSQDAVMLHNKILGDELKARLDCLTARFDSLAGELSDLRAKCASFDTRISNLESTSTSVLPSTSISDVIHEFSERDKCKFNIITHGLPESTSPNQTIRINDDKNRLITELNKVSITLPTDFKSIRLGRTTSSPRPLKIILNDPDVAARIIKSFRSAKLLTPDVCPALKIVRDKTRLEREKLRACHTELNGRVQAGELDLLITYVNGIPCVMKSRSKNASSQIHLNQT